MRRSIGYGAYDGFGEDLARTPALYKGSVPIRLGRGSVEVKGKDDKGPVNKKYTFEAGITPFGVVLTALGGVGFLYIIFRVTKLIS